MKHQTRTKRPLAALLALCLSLSLCVPALALGEELAPSATLLALLEEGEGFRAEKYYEGGNWYIGFGTQCGESDYPYGITREEAEALLLQKLAKYEIKLTEFFTRYGIVPTQGQFDALLSFCYNFGTGWLTGTSDLVRIVRGEVTATRLETAQAFLQWCHSGGEALGGLAARRLQEASLYLDGSLWAAENEFAYLIIKKETGATYEADYRVYQRGTLYASLPAAEKLGSRLVGYRTTDGTLLTETSLVAGNASASAEWAANTYTGRSYTDVTTADWFYDYVMELSAGGVINGYENGTFQPYAETKAGELLKLVLLAAGHTAQSPTSLHWASGYATYALSMGHLSSLYSDQQLDGAISRLEVARLAAKALGYGASTAASPFADVNDGYVTALYEAGVFVGTTDASGGIVFAPSSSITRAEVAAVIYRIYRLSALDTKQKIRYNDYTLDVLEGVPVNSYDKSAFVRSGSTMYYTAPGVMTRLGIDVSQYQTDIDWAAVAGSGVSFVIARVGGRGYTEGGIYTDTMFASHAAGAAAAGLQVGAYFFSQAISVQEAQEEAFFVLDQLRGHSITGPVVFDWESIGRSIARTYGLSTTTLCDCANAFCSIIAAAGYQPMIYFNDYDGYVKYDLSRILNYPFWYANYNDTPGFYYDFAMWQYTSKGSVPGIKGNVDMDLWFIR